MYTSHLGVSSVGQLLAQTNCGQSNYLHVPNGVIVTRVVVSHNSVFLGSTTGRLRHRRSELSGIHYASEERLLRCWCEELFTQIAVASSQAQLLTGRSTKRGGVSHGRSFAGMAAAAAAAMGGGGNASTSGLYNSALAEL